MNCWGKNCCECLQWSEDRLEIKKWKKGYWNLVVEAQIRSSLYQIEWYQSLHFFLFISPQGLVSSTRCELIGSHQMHASDCGKGRLWDSGPPKSWESLSMSVGEFWKSCRNRASVTKQHFNSQFNFFDLRLREVRMEMFSK